MTSWRRTLLRVSLGLVGVLAVVAVLVGMNLRAVVRWSMTPRVAFDVDASPAAPDYGDDAAWSALPTREDLADRAPRGLSAIAAAEATADVFYVHPTSHVGPTWNGRVGDPSLDAATDRVATGIQAAAFNGCCAVYAPRYRQATGIAFVEDTADGRAAIDLAYEDVSHAFDAFLARVGDERPFILAGHSQGSVHLERLLRERVANTTALRDRLVVAYLPGGRLTRAGLDGLGLRACSAPDDVGCVVAWNARAPSYVPGPFELFRDDTTELLCSNPLHWRDDGSPATAAQSLGAVFLESSDATVQRNFVTARCERGWLRVEVLYRIPRDFMSTILDTVLGAGNYHPIEYQLFFVDLRRNAAVRVAAWQRAHGR